MNTYENIRVTYEYLQTHTIIYGLYMNLGNSARKIRALIGQKSCFYNSMETEQARAVDVMMARAKKIYILIMKVNKLFSFFSSQCFLKEIENMFSVFLSSYRNTRERWENSKKLRKHSPAVLVLTAFFVLPYFHSCFYNSIETRFMFSIS